jgi:hypothetical protein
MVTVGHDELISFDTLLIGKGRQTVIVIVLDAIVVRRTLATFLVDTFDLITKVLHPFLHIFEDIFSFILLFKGCRKSKPVRATEKSQQCRPPKY